MNKQCASTGNLNATAQMPPRRIVGRKAKIQSEMIVTDEGFRFGVQTRPSTPMNGVVGNLYGRIAAEVQNAVYKRPVSSQNIAAGKKIAYEPRQNRASDLLKSYVKSNMRENKNPKSTFKMKKFLNVKPRTKSNQLNPAFILNKTLTSS